MEDIKLNLPITKAIVTFKGYLTTGQSRELQKILLSKGEIDPQNGNAIKSMSPETVLDMQDKAAEMLIISVDRQDGNPPFQFSQDWLNDLPVTDGNAVYDQINKLIGSTANLSEESKKK